MGFSTSVAREHLRVTAHEPCAMSDTRRGCVGQTALRGRLHLVPYHDSSCRRPFTEREYEDALLGVMARSAHASDTSTSVSEYTRLFDRFCTFDAPLEVSTSCVTMLSCNFNGDHIYMSRSFTYSPSDICSTPDYSAGEPTASKRVAMYSGRRLTLTHACALDSGWGTGRC